MSLHRGPARRDRIGRIIGLVRTGRIGRKGAMAAAGSAAAVVAAVVVVALTAHATGPQACTAAAAAAAPSGSPSGSPSASSLRAAPVAALLPRAGIPTGTGWRTGVATFYGKDAPGGACSFVEKAPGGYTAALGPDEYAAGAACGMTLEVKGRRGGVRVKVTNLCPECPRGHLDLTDEAFAKVDDPARGKVAISYRVVADPPLPGPLTVRVKEGSSQWWLALLVDRHGNALRSVEVSSGGAWKPLSRTDYNYWLAAAGAGRGPFTVRVTDVRGHRATLPGITLRPGVVQRSTVFLYPSTAAAPSPASAPPPTSPPASTPSGSPSRTAAVARAATRSPAPAAAATAVSSATGRPGTSTPGPGLPAAGAAPAPTTPQECR